jgi:hypothetical protein
MDDVLIHVRGVLATTPSRWVHLASRVPVALLGRPPAPGEWSALACLQHIVAAEERVFPVRIRAFLDGRDFAAYDPVAEDVPGTTAAAEELARRFADLRTASLAALDPLTEDDLGRTARHAELGIVTLSELLHQWAGHDLMHTVQAERAVMQPFVDGCGPWRPYFADHDVAAVQQGP